MDVSPPGRFAPSLDVSPPRRSPPGRFAPWTFRPLDVSPPGRFAPKTFRPLTGRFAPTVDVLPPSVDFSPPLVSCNFCNVLLRYSWQSHVWQIPGGSSSISQWRLLNDVIGVTSKCSADRALSNCPTQFCIGLGLLHVSFLRRKIGDILWSTR